MQGDTGHAQASMVTDVYARTNNTQRKKLARLVEQNFFETMKEKTGDPNFNQTEKIAMAIVRYKTHLKKR